MRRALLTGAVIAAATVVLPGAGRAVTTTQVICGQTIQHSVVLANGLLNCPGNGLVIDAANVTVNLNGFSLAGDGGGGGNGINAAGGFANLTILNGSITGFVSGISVTNGSHISVAGVTSYANTSKGIATDGTVGVSIQKSYTHGNPDDGIDVVENSTGAIKISGVGSYGDGVGVDVTGAPATIDGNVFANEAGTAIQIEGPDGFQVTNNRVLSAGAGGVSAIGVGTVSGNVITRTGTVGIETDGGVITQNTIGVATQEGIKVSGSRKATVTSNHITSAGEGGIWVAANGAASTGSKIEGNFIGSASSEPGIFGEANGGIAIKGNTIVFVTDSGNGISTQGDAVKVTDNQIGSVSSNGVVIGPGTGATVSGNTVTSAGTGQGFFISAGSSTISGNTVWHAGDNGMYVDNHDGDLIQGNHFEGAPHDGLRLDPGGHNHTVKANLANGNNEVGIHDESASGTVLSSNVAVDNTTGISSDNGTDGGKNKAAGNVTLQCGQPITCTAP